jgi:opacity protein-like surface antigen
MTKSPVIVFISIAIGLLAPAAVQAEWQLDFESGVAASGYNDVGIPGNSGTMFSFSRDLDTDPTPFWRLRVSRTFGEKHTFSVLIAPLRLRAEGRFNRDVHFAGEVYASGNPVEARYRFDSYRLTYRYDFHRRDRLRLGIGFTSKIRDAAISVEGDGRKSEKTNTGFVPLINFRVRWQASQPIGMILEGDALAAPQGRAEDVLLGLIVDASENLQFKAGYRFLEGGADNDEVYTFAMINYLTVGATWTF